MSCVWQGGLPVASSAAHGNCMNTPRHMRTPSLPYTRSRDTVDLEGARVDITACTRKNPEQSKFCTLRSVRPNALREGQFNSDGSTCTPLPSHTFWWEPWVFRQDGQDGDQDKGGEGPRRHGWRQGQEEGAYFSPGLRFFTTRLSRRVANPMPPSPMSPICRSGARARSARSSRTLSCLTRSCMIDWSQRCRR